MRVALMPAARRLRMLAKGDRAFSRYGGVAPVAMPAFVPGISPVQFYVFMLGLIVAGSGAYAGLSYFPGAEIAQQGQRFKKAG